MSYSTAEVKTGFLIFISFILLFGLTFGAGRYLSGETSQWSIRFAYAGGLEKNAPVYFAGREAGKVDNITILPGEARPIRVSIRLSSDILLRQDTEAFIDVLGMMGEKIIELSPGSEGAEFLTPGTELQGVDPVPMHVMMSKMNLLADRFDEMSQLINPMLTKTSEFFKGYEEEVALSLANIHQITINVRDLTNDLKHRPWRLVRKNS